MDVVIKYCLMSVLSQNQLNLGMLFICYIAGADKFLEQSHNAYTTEI